MLKFNVNKNNENQFYSIVEKYLKSKLTFQRRIALIILFKFINDKNIDKVLQIINSLHDEKEYYVNMANAWLLCECFIKQKEKTYKLLNNHNLNKFTINKAISKCRDSFRVHKEDKDNLVKYRIK